MVFGCLGGDVAKYSDAGVVLFEIGEVFKQRFDSLGAEENQHVVEDVAQVGQIARHALVHDGRFEVELLLLEVIDYIFLAEVGTRDEEARGGFMLLQCAGEVHDGALADKHFALAVLDEFLEVMGDRLRGTEVLHVLGHLYAHFFTEAEEVIDAVFARHHHGLEFIRADAVLAKFFFRYRLDMIKRPPVNPDVVFFLNVIVW